MQVINRRKVSDSSGEKIKLNATVGQVTEGIYEGSTPQPWHDSVNNVDKVLTIHSIKMKGMPRNFIGNASLDRQLAQVAPGNYVSITFKGKIQLQGGRSFNTYEVETGEIMDDSEENFVPHKTPKSSDSVTDEEQGLELPF